MVLPFDQSAADHFGPIAASLAQRGEQIGTLDTLLAAHAVSVGLTFVTNNTLHFRRVSGLRTENWV
jgi:tRNA(fMet)-specific endonuclease VapC